MGLEREIRIETSKENLEFNKNDSKQELKEIEMKQKGDSKENEIGVHLLGDEDLC
jgi:hypothetical protein